MASSFRMKRSADGGGNSDRPTQSKSVAGGHHTATSGIWTRWWFPSLAVNTGFGVQLTKTVMFSMRLFKARAIRKPRGDC